MGCVKALVFLLQALYFRVYFGVLAIHTGLSMQQGLIFSAAVYAGALQMVSLHLWPVQPIPTFTLVALSFVVCARYFLMGMVLRPKLDANKSSTVYRTLFFVWLHMDGCFNYFIT